MGLIISKFRKQKSTIEVLEEIDKNIATHQKTKRQNQEYQKKFIASLILYSIIIYVVATIIFFICYFPETWKDWLFASIPLLLFPILIWLVKKIMHWYFVKRIASNDLKLQELRDKKKEILEDVMENETYKKAKEILEKYDPARFKKLEDEKPGPPTKSTDEDQVPPVVRQRVITTRTMSPVMRMPNPVQPMSAPHPHQTQRTPNPSVGSPMRMITQMNGRQMSMAPLGYGRSPGPPIPRPIPPRERKNLDKFIDYLVGEGPQNRYALICRYCNSHNGMAMKEEFEYISFRCCYCYHLNPAKKQRPHAPRLDFPTPQSSPARKAIAAPDSKSKEEGESSEEEDDDASTSSKKSGDETIESEKTENEIGDEAAAEASDAEAADIPMADEDGTEEKAQDGVKEHDDEIVSEIKQEEPEVNQDITEEILAADNQPAAVEAEATTESKEHKTKKEEAVVSESITVEKAPLTHAEKPEAPVEVPKSVDLAPELIEAAPETVEIVAEEAPKTEVTPETVVVAAEEAPKTEVAPETVEIAAEVAPETVIIAAEEAPNTEVAPETVVIAAEEAPKIGEVPETVVITAEEAPKTEEAPEPVAIAAEEAPKVEEAPETVAIAAEEAPETMAIAAEETSQTEEAPEPVAIAAEEAAKVEEAPETVAIAAEETPETVAIAAEEVPQTEEAPVTVAIEAEDVPKTEEAPVTVAIAAEDVPKTEEAPVTVAIAAEDVPKTEEAPVTVAIAAEDVPKTEEAPVTVDIAAEEAPVATETNLQQIVEDAPITVAEDVLTTTIAAPQESVDAVESLPVAEEAPVAEDVSKTVDNSNEEVQVEVSLIPDDVAEEVAVTVVDQAFKEALGTAENATLIALKAVKTADESPQPGVSPLSISTDTMDSEEDLVELEYEMVPKVVNEEAAPEDKPVDDKHEAVAVKEDISTKIIEDEKPTTEDSKSPSK